MEKGSEPAILTLSCPEWKDYFLGFVHHLWKENILCDTQIKCRNDDTVNAHSIVLASCSPLLKKFFMKCRPGLYTVKMDTTSTVMWGYLLEFLYTGKLQLPKNQFMAFFNLVGKLKVKQAVEMCQAYMLKQMDKPETAASPPAITTTPSTPTATAAEIPG
jgi:hypothetical protein